MTDVESTGITNSVRLSYILTVSNLLWQKQHTRRDMRAWLDYLTIFAILVALY